MIFTNNENKLDMEYNYIKNEITKHCKLLFEILLKLCTFEVL